MDNVTCNLCVYVLNAGMSTNDTGVKVIVDIRHWMSSGMYLLGTYLMIQASPLSNGFPTSGFTLCHRLCVPLLQLIRFTKMRPPCYV